MAHLGGRDGQPIVWPQPTHHKHPQRGQKRWRSAAECIDWRIPGKSIFGRQKPLADATLRRIAKGIQRFVLDNPQPFIVPIAHYNGSEPVHSGTEPLRTITAHPKGGAFAVAQPQLAPVQIQAAHGEGSGKTQRRSIGSKNITAPIGTITASGSGGHAVATAYMMQANGGFYQGAGRPISEPASTITNSGSQQQLVSACLIRQFGTSHGADIAQPMGTIMTDGSGGKTGLISCTLAAAEARALQVAAFLIKFF